MRSGQSGATAPIPEGGLSQSVPDWVVDRVASALNEILDLPDLVLVHLRVVSFGDTEPQCFTRHEACRQRNRRVRLRAAQRQWPSYLTVR
jgi:hypothetical protein